MEYRAKPVLPHPLSIFHLLWMFLKFLPSQIRHLCCGYVDETAALRERSEEESEWASRLERFQEKHTERWGWGVCGRLHQRVCGSLGLKDTLHHMQIPGEALARGGRQGLSQAEPAGRRRLRHAGPTHRDPQPDPGGLHEAKPHLSAFSLTCLALLRSVSSTASTHWPWRWRRCMGATRGALRVAAPSRTPCP